MTNRNSFRDPQSWSSERVQSASERNSIVHITHPKFSSKNTPRSSIYHRQSVPGEISLSLGLTCLYERLCGVWTFESESLCFHKSIDWENYLTRMVCDHVPSVDVRYVKTSIPECKKSGCSFGSYMLSYPNTSSINLLKLRRKAPW